MQTPNDGPAMAMPAGYQSMDARPRRRMPLGTIALYVALTALAVLFCIPFVWLVLTSLKPPAEVFSPGWIPSEWRWDNYVDVFEVAPVGRWLWNTVVITTLAVAAVVLSSSLVAYGFARLRFRGRNALFALVIGTYLLPGAVTMIPTFLIWNELGAVNTFWPLWAGNLFGSAFYIFMLRQFLLTIPQDLMDAARIDGAGFFRIYWSLMLPLIRPALVAVAIFEANAKWDDFMGPLIYLNSPDNYTLALGLGTMKQSLQELGTQWTLLLTASVIFTIPMMILFFMFQRFFMEGATHSGIKG
ncbi:MAG TPA: carbohydrate ABC transporter permease [Thermomicrobiales bacterium]|nr:carbohydrate ABC transporter permease [Thermomicrobiales bacterium]